MAIRSNLGSESKLLDENVSSNSIMGSHSNALLKRGGSACCWTKVFNRSAGDTLCHPDGSSDDAILIHFRIFY